MNRSRLAAGLALGTLVLVGYGLVGTAQGEPDAPKPVAKIEHVMLTVNAGDTSVVGQLREAFNKPSLDDEEFGVAAARATMVMEAANLLWGMTPPKGAGDAAGVAKWREHVMSYRGCADAVREAATKKDLAGGKAAVASLAKQCNACHKDHKGD